MTFRGKRFVEHEIEGTVFRFYPNRIALLEEAASLSQPIADALLTLLSGTKDSDAGSKFTRQTEGQFVREDSEVPAVTVEVLEYRKRERREALDKAFGTLADPRSRLLLGKLLMDSLRDEFEFKSDRTVSEVEEFLYGDGEGDYVGLDTPALIGFLTGWMKANARVFGSTGESLVGLAKKRLEALHADSLSDETEPSPTAGSSSPKPSSPR